MRGKGKLDAHGNIGAEEEHTIPHLSMDYCFMGQDESKTLPILVLKDHRHKVVFSNVVPSKGTQHDYCVKQLHHNISQMGYPKLLLKTDQEPAILDLRKACVRLCNLDNIEILREESPVAEHPANGVVEQAVQAVEGQVRTLKAVSYTHLTLPTILLV